MLVHAFAYLNTMEILMKVVDQNAQLTRTVMLTKPVWPTSVKIPAQVPVAVMLNVKL